MIALAGEERKEEVRRENNHKMSRNKEGVPLSEIRARTTRKCPTQDPRPKVRKFPLGHLRTGRSPRMEKEPRHQVCPSLSTWE
eukprot:scaffold39912_cov124-Skeletonema_marinoi.AAC.1